LAAPADRRRLDPDRGARNWPGLGRPTLDARPTGSAAKRLGNYRHGAAIGQAVARPAARALRPLQIHYHKPPPGWHRASPTNWAANLLGEPRSDGWARMDIISVKLPAPPPATFHLFVGRGG